MRILALLRGLHKDESGQGLVEYLLIVPLVALAATAGMTQAASCINSASSGSVRSSVATSARREISNYW
jgi:Flp pilus assembly pilin Flp